MDRAHWNRRYEGWDLVWAEDPNRFVADRAADLPVGRALDLACGEGRNAVWLAGRGWDVVAVDWADVALRKGRALAERHGVAVEWVEADLTGYIPDPGRFGLVLLSYLQVPPADRQVIWPRAVAAVAPGGTFICVAHDSRNLAEGSGGPRDPEVLYSAGDVTPFLEGFVITEAGEVRREVAPADEGADPTVAIDCLVVAHRAASA